MDGKTRRHFRRLAHSLHTDQVQAALRQAGVVDQVRVALVESRLDAAVGDESPLLRSNEGAGVVATFMRVLDAAAEVYPREVASVRARLEGEVEARGRTD